MHTPLNNSAIMNTAAPSLSAGRTPHRPQVAQVSQAAKPLAWWSLSVAELLRVGREADIKRAKIAEAEQRLEEAAG